MDNHYSTTEHLEAEDKDDCLRILLRQLGNNMYLEKGQDELNLKILIKRVETDK